MKFIYIIALLCLFGACGNKLSEKEESACHEDIVATAITDTVISSNKQENDTLEQVAFTHNTEISVYHKILSAQSENKYWKVELSFELDSVDSIIQPSGIYPVYNLIVQATKKNSNNYQKRLIITRDLFSLISKHNLNEYSLITCTPINSTKDDITLELSIGIPDTGMFETASLTFGGLKASLTYIDHPEPGENEE